MSSVLFVVPTLDSYHLLPRLYQSLCSQSFQEWNVLFVDGPSKPTHRKWLQECCNSDSRFIWIPQTDSTKGIYGAMNDGFRYAVKTCHEWLLFWGSDDWPSSVNSLSDVMASLAQHCIGKVHPDIVVCQAQYSNVHTFSKGRYSNFQSEGLIDRRRFRRLLWHGETPAHQATLIGIGARKYLSYYSTSFSLAADLDFFLKLTNKVDFMALCLNLQIVHIGEAGVSGQFHVTRIKEVLFAYFRAFGLWFYIPFLLRYFKRTSSYIYSLSFRD